MAAKKATKRRASRARRPKVEVVETSGSDLAGSAGGGADPEAIHLDALPASEADAIREAEPLIEADEFVGADGAPGPDGSAHPGASSSAEDAEAIRAAVLWLTRSVFDLVAGRRGEHWALNDAEAEMVAEPLAEVLAAYGVDLDTPETRLCVAAAIIVVPRLAQDRELARKPADAGENDGRPG